MSIIKRLIVTGITTAIVAGLPTTMAESAHASGPLTADAKTAPSGKTGTPISPATKTPTPDWTVSLDLHEGTAPTMPAPKPGTTQIPVLDGSPGIDDYTGNAVGCAATCITTAVLTDNHLNADLAFDTTSNVAVTTTVWILPAGPFIINGLPAHLGKVPFATSGSPQTQWSTTVSPLQSDHSYRIVVAATDHYGNTDLATTIFTTNGPADDLVGTGSPCQFQCITSAEVIPIMSYHQVDIEVHANADVSFEFAVSTQQPIILNDLPILPADVATPVLHSSTQHQRVRMSGLAADTTYNVVITATDSSGNNAYASGSFHTGDAPPPPPAPTDVFVQFERVHIHDDGDPGALNKGEIALAWALGYDAADPLLTGYRDKDKLDTGQSVNVSGSGGWISLSQGGDFPGIYMTAYESDRSGAAPGTCSISTSAVVTAPTFFEPCDTTANVIRTNPLGMGWLDTLAPCPELGLDKPDRVCAVLESQRIGSDYVDFDLLMSFAVVDNN